MKNGNRQSRIPPYNHFMSTLPKIRIGILTISDRASQGIYQDLGGPAIRDCLAEILTCPWEPVACIIPDERPLIEKSLRELCDQEKCCLVVTTGGTGPARRDVTPEATEAVCDKLLDGFGELMRAVSLTVVPTAILSRQTAGIRGQSLVVNLPGKPSAIRDCLLAVFPAIPYCVDLIEGPYLTTNENVVKAFRPKK
jgi:molybdopterin adenylyltransferase